MGHSGTIINGNTGIRFREDIAEVLGVGSGDLGTLCMSGRVNKWAKYKPLRSANLGYLTESERKELMYGLKVTRFSLASTLLANFSSEWEYLQPRANGWSLSPKELYRAFDFVKVSDQGTPDQSHGYNHAAICPVSGWTPSIPGGLYTKGQGGLTIAMATVTTSSTPQDSVTFADLPVDPQLQVESLSSYYFGVLLLAGVDDSSFVYQGIKTSGNPLSYSAFNDVSFADSEFQYDWYYYRFVPILSPVAYATLNSTGSFSNNEILVAPNMPMATVRVAPQSAIFGISMLYDEDHNDIPYVTAYFDVRFLVVTLNMRLHGINIREITYSVYEGDDTSGTLLKEDTLYSGLLTREGVVISDFVIQIPTQHWDTITVSIDLLPSSQGAGDGQQLGLFEAIPVGLPPLD